MQLCEEELEEKIATQTAELVRIREALVNVCEKEDLQLLLLINDCELSDPSMEELLDQCADILAFGSLYKCQKCLKGDMIFSKHGYTCNAWLDDWVKCGHFEVEPLRMKCTIPDDLKANPFFATCDPKSEDRAVRPIVIDLDSPTPSTSASPASNKRKPKTTKLLLKDGTVVDPKSKLQSTTHVYRKDKVLYSCVLGLTDIQKNKNSFYKLQVLESDYKHLNIGRSYYFFFSMGRTGTTIGSFSTRNFNSADLAVAEFEKLYQQTTGNDWNTRQNFKKVPGKFYPIDVNYGDEEVEDNNNIASRLDSRVQDLMKLLFNVNNMQITMNEFKLDLQKMPLGKLSGEQLKSAEAALEALEEAVCNRSPRLVLIGLSNKFFTLIPHSFGFEAAPVLDALAEINKKREMVESLHDIENAYAMMAKARKLPAMSSLDSYYSQLNASVEVLDQNSGIYRLIKTYVNNTSMHGFRLEILDIYKVQRFEEEKRSDQFKQLSNRQLLWHGSRITNFVSIIKNGLKISPQVHGSMFGRGIYFADMVSKSANYCQTSSSTEGLLALCEVALGNVHELYQAQNCQGPPPNYNSIKGVGQTQPNDTEVLTMQDGVAVPLGKPKAVVIPRVQQNTASSNVSSLQTFQNFLANRVPNARVPSLLYNEYIIYDDRRIKLQYLVKFKQI